MDERLTGGLCDSVRKVGRDCCSCQAQSEGLIWKTAVELEKEGRWEYLGGKMGLGMDAKGKRWKD